MKVALQFNNVSKKFNSSEKSAVSNINLTIYDGEIITILGASGSGKTTLLKMVNRLYNPDKGEILYFGKNINEFDPIVLRRQIGYVIQNTGLFPHMRVGENIATVPKILKWDKNKINQRVLELLNLINLNPKEYINRYPNQLSGGQQQRVGLARALAGDPNLLLMDEPFGAIDAISRNHLQDELLFIHKKYNKTILFVTHDVAEAIKLGSRILIMNNGKIEQLDTPENIIKNPTGNFVKSLIFSATHNNDYINGGGI